MDPEKRARRQSLKIILSESVMVLAVVSLVVILALLVSGYWLNSDFEVERQGMLQVNSFPTGATVEIDGDAPWFQRTNTSKVLSSGEHTVLLTKEGYDSWSKTVNIREGLLYRLYYPRLFLKERTKTPVYSTPTTTFATVSKDTNTMLLINNTTNWNLLNLETENIESKTLDISNIFTQVSKAPGATAGLFDGIVTNAWWSEDNEHVLIKSESEGNIEWVLLNIKNPKSSVNITHEFGTNFSDIRIFNNSASNLLALNNQNLYKIDTVERQISAVIVSGVIKYNFYGQEIIFTAKIPNDETYDYSDEIIKFSNAEESKPNFYTGIIKNGDQKITHILSSADPSVPYLSQFYDNKYITIINGESIVVYKYDGSEEIISKTLPFTPDEIKLGYGDGFIFMRKGKSVAVLDMEAQEIVNWSLDSEHYGWLNGDMLYAILDGNLIVYDFDGLNRRSLSSNVSYHFPVVITNTKWLYYFSDDQLIREKIIN